MKAFALSLSILVIVSFSMTSSASEVLKASARLPQFPLIGDQAPGFEAESTDGKIDFPKDYSGKWVILFSHPADFTPVCTSEFVLFGSVAHEFKKLNTELLGLSIGEIKKHHEWKRSIKDKIVFQGIKNQEIRFPIIADTDQEIAWRYGMLHPTVSDTRTVRAVFVVDPLGVIRAINYYPPEVGRNVSELKRLVIALQTSDAHQVATPANWEPGEDVLVKPGDKSSPDKKCQEWYFCFQQLDKSKLKLP